MKEKTYTKPRIDIKQAPIEENKYYRSISQKYRAAKYAAIIVFCAYLIVMLAVNRKSMTYENFMYLLKDISPGETTSEGNFSAIKFEESVLASVIFRSDLATVDSHSVSLYRHNAKMTYSYSHSYDNPVLASGSKYLLAYDLGGKSYSLYTNVSKVFSGTSDYEIVGADIADDGSFALITKSNESKFTVSFYDSNFKHRYNFHKDKYVIDCAITKDASKIVIVSTELSSSRPEGEIMICTLGESTPDKTVKEADFFPLDVIIFGDGNIAVIGSKKTLFLSKEGDTISRFDYGNDTVSRVSCADGGMLISLREDSLGEKNTLYILNSSGNITFTHSAEGAVGAMALSPDLERIFLTVRDRIFMVTQNGDASESPLGEDCIALLSYGDFVLALHGMETAPHFNQADSKK